MAHLPNLQFIEMHDPTDCSQGSNDQPYAYVADRVQIGALDTDMHKIMNEGPGIANVAMKSCVSLSHKGDDGAKIIAPSRTAKPQCELPTKRTVTNPVEAPLPKGEENSSGGESADATAAFRGTTSEDGDELMFEFDDDVETGTP